VDAPTKAADPMASVERIATMLFDD
jgi:hypothetical protein